MEFATSLVFYIVLISSGGPRSFTNFEDACRASNGLRFLEVRASKSNICVNLNAVNCWPDRCEPCEPPLEHSAGYVSCVEKEVTIPEEVIPEKRIPARREIRIERVEP